jgi:Transposase
MRSPLAATKDRLLCSRSVCSRAEKKAPAGRISPRSHARCLHAGHRHSCFSASQAPYCLPHVCHTRPPFSLSAKQESLVRSKPSTSNRFEPDAPPLERAYQLSQEFVMMLAERREADLDSWLTQAEHSGLPEFKKWRRASARMMPRGTAALSSEWSNDYVA